MPEVRIVFSDLDDTFVARDKSVPAENLRVLDTLYDRGIPFVPCTGRGFAAIPTIVRGHPASRYFVTSSGAVVNDAWGRIIWSRAIGPERTLALYEMLRDLDISFDVFADGRIFAERSRFSHIPNFGIAPEHLALLLKSRTVVDLTVEQIVERAEVVERVGIFWSDGAEGERDAAAVKAAIDAIPGLRWTTSYRLGVEVVDSQASKGEALSWLCEHLGIPRACSVAFGDSPNDTEMMLAAGTGVAMENAYPELVAVADDTCPSCDDAGVARWLASHL